MLISLPASIKKRYQGGNLSFTVALALLISTTAVGSSNPGSHQPMLSVDKSGIGRAGLISGNPPVLRYSNLYADDEGRTHVQYCQLRGFAFRSYAPPAAAQWLGIPPGEIKSIAYAVLPVGYVGAWHHSPGPQWVVTLSGRWSVEATDGAVLEQGPGEVQFNADMTAKPQRPDGHIGHLTRTVGDVPNVQLIVSLKVNSGEVVSVAPCQPSER